ncbi:MAG: hypothetical protein J1E07_07170, partial [Treponema sp.]|nr:hypothetical protein [Treponema sp.]
DTENWSDDFVPVVFSNSDCKICGLQYLHKDFFMQDSETFGEELRKSAMESGATQAFPIFSHSFVKNCIRMEIKTPSAKILLADNLRAWKSAFITLDRAKRGLIIFGALFCGTGRQSD